MAQSCVTRKRTKRSLPIRDKEKKVKERNTRRALLCASDVKGAVQSFAV